MAPPADATAAARVAFREQLRLPPRRQGNPLRIGGKDRGVPGGPGWM